jgi:hypothetical protein
VFSQEWYEDDMDPSIWCRFWNQDSEDLESSQVSPVNGFAAFNPLNFKFLVFKMQLILVALIFLNCWKGQIVQGALKLT